MGAGCVSVVALVLSWLAYRQTARYHPQPKLVFEWDRELKMGSLPAYRVFIANHGDAAARDLEFTVQTTARYPKPWEARMVLEPADSWVCDVPLVTGADWGEGSMGRVWKGNEERVSPLVTLTWRQAPFDGRKKRMQGRPPATGG